MISLKASEVAAYYWIRMPDLRQRGTRWRGRCPVHRGRRDSFSVDPETGLWRCWSDCARGGDVIELEIALTGEAFPQARGAVFSVIGRHEVFMTPADRRAAAIERAQNGAQHELAAHWRNGRLFQIRAQLEAEKLKLLDSAFEDEAAGEMVYELTTKEIALKQLTAVELIPTYRDALTSESESAHTAAKHGEQIERDAHLFLARIIKSLSESSPETE